MEMALEPKQLLQYLQRQIEHFFPDGGMILRDECSKQAMRLALERTEYCFSFIKEYTKEVNRNKQVLFDYMHSDQYAQFLYFFSNSLYKLTGEDGICSKIISLNKALSGCFYSYKGKLPDIFYLMHPVGSIIGNATYSDFLVILQNVTINSSDTSIVEGKKIETSELKIGKGVFLGAGAQIIGYEEIGNRVSIGAGTTVYKEKIEDDCIVYRDKNGNMITRKREEEYCCAQNFFNVII